jgi:hypothetical protein
MCRRSESAQTRKFVLLGARLRRQLCICARLPQSDSRGKRGDHAWSVPDSPTPQPHDRGERPNGLLDNPHPRALVRRAGSAYPTPQSPQCHGCLVPHGVAAGPHPLGALPASRSPRPMGEVRHAGRAVYRCGGRPAPDRLLVHFALAARGDLPRSACAPWCGDESANGPTARSPARPRPCSASSLW